MWGQAANELSQTISNATNYVNTVYGTYHNYLVNNVVKPDNHNCEPFKTVNAFDRQMTQTVLDYMDSWPYYDPTQYPNGAVNPDNTPIDLFTREIYSDPYGTCDDSGPIHIPSQPRQRPTNITVWSQDYINAVQLTYPTNSGPGLVTQTKRMGEGANYKENTDSFNLSTNKPFIGARATWGSIVNSMQFVYEGGGLTPVVGGGYVDRIKPNDTGILGFAYYALSSIHINGVSIHYTSADCVVFGFMPWKTPAATLANVQAVYVTSPKEHTMADFAQAFPKLALTEALITNELKAKRKAYWESIQERAKKPK